MKAVGWIVGALLLAFAVLVAVDALPRTMELLAGVERPDPWKLTLLPALVLCNLLLTGEIFHLLARRFVRITRLEDLAVVSALTLANYLPFRPGIFMRVGYFKGRHEVPVGSTVRVLAEAYGTTVACVLILLVLVPSFDALSFGVAWAWVAGFATVTLGMAFGRLRLHARICLIRMVELLLWAIRLHIAFALIGEPIDFAVATAVSLAGMSVQMIPLFGNGLGLREWATGLLAGLLAGTPLGVALAAELLVRAAELLVVVPCGIIATGWLARHSRSSAA
jgi:hypothetical protein